MARFEGVGGFGEENGDILFGELFEFFDFGELDVACRAVVEFVIGGVEDFAFRCFDYDAHTIGDGVGDADEFTGEFAKLENVVGGDCVEFCEAVLFEFFDAVFDHADGEFEAVGWRKIEFRQDVRYGADVIEMAVGEDDAADAIEFVFEVADVGDDVVDTEHVFGWEFDADVNNDDVVFVFEDGHVFADFV